MDEKIYLSPAVKIVSLDKKNLYLKIYSKLYHLTGDKIEKYLLSNIEYFFMNLLNYFPKSMESSLIYMNLMKLSSYF